MIMPGSVKNNVTRLRPRPRNTMMGEGSSASATATSASNPNVGVPVTTQVTTAVSPVFNISAGNSGGGGVSQSGTTSQSATPSASNMMQQGGAPVPGLPGMPGSDSGMLGQPGITDYGLTPAAYPTDGSYISDSSLPTGSAYNQTPGSGLNVKMLLIFGGLALGAWLLLSPKGKQQSAVIVRQLSGKRSTKKRAKRAKTKA